VKGADEPKKGRTAYVLFMMDYRAALKANPTQQPQAAETQAETLANFATVSKQVSEAWKRMDAAARAPYLQRQQAEMAECVPLSHPLPCRPLLATPCSIPCVPCALG